MLEDHKHQVEPNIGTKWRVSSVNKNTLSTLFFSILPSDGVKGTWFFEDGRGDPPEDRGPGPEGGCSTQPGSTLYNWSSKKKELDAGVSLRLMCLVVSFYPYIVLFGAL